MLENVACPQHYLMNDIQRKSFSHWLKKLQPILGIFFLVAIITFGQELGMILLGVYFFLFSVIIILEKPDKCLRGHTDIGYYYGRWSCRTCYKLERQWQGRRLSKRSRARDSK